MGTKDFRLMVFPRWALLGSLGVVMFASLVWMSDASRKSETAQNLQSAYTGEANAYVRYLAFAERAQEEEHGEVASLFRAAACAEHVHLKNHAAVLRKMGCEPVLKIDTPVVKTTAENLRTAADAGEAYERDTMYPQFIKQARAEGNEDAVRTFQYAMTAEAQHFKLFKDALNNLKRMNAPSHLYYVCNVCGYTAEHAVTPCPGCGDPKAEFEEMF